MKWRLRRKELDNASLLTDESLFSLGNGYLGIRGNFEEGYPEGFDTIRGTYINAFHDETEIHYGEKLYAFPDKQQKMVNVTDAQTIRIDIDDEHYSPFEGEIVHYERTLHLDKGYSERIIHWRSPKGREANICFRRLISFATKELFILDVKVEPLKQVKEVTIHSLVNGEVLNFADDSDPRVASGHAKLLDVTEIRKEKKLRIVKSATRSTKLEVSCTASSAVQAGSIISYDSWVNEHRAGETYTVSGPVQYTLFNVYTDTLRHGEKLVTEGKIIHEKLCKKTFDDILADQKEYLDHFWSSSDIRIDGDDKLQVGLRFNLFHLLQSVGKDHHSNISAKGLSGEGYEGHYFWDTEIYIFPFFLMTNTKIARNLLLHRYSLLESAKKRAREMGHEKGALFPWRTITGPESSAYFPAGTAQYHISADIAYSYIQYYLVTKDQDFLKQYMAEVLFETARLWTEIGHFHKDQFRIDDVTGPDEYTCIVNNNYYTNAMAKNNLLWAYKVYHLLKEDGDFQHLADRIGLSSGEVREWKEAADKMYLPYDESKKISAQDDSFLQKNAGILEVLRKIGFRFCCITTR